MSKLNKKACEVLHKTEEFLSRWGAWTTGEMIVIKGERVQACLLGAVCEVSGHRMNDFEYERSKLPRHVQDAIVAIGCTISPEIDDPNDPKIECTITDFNDNAPDKRRVLNILRKTREAEGC